MNVDDLEQRIAYIESLGLDSERIIKSKSKINSIPRIQENIEYVTDELGLTTKVFERHPALFSYSIEDNLKPKVEYVTDELGLSNKVFERFPNLFGLSIEDNLKPKVEYVTEELGLSNKVFERLPALFGYSMKNRIWPRSELLNENGFDAGEELLKHITKPNSWFETRYDISEREINNKSLDY